MIRVYLKLTGLLVAISLLAACAHYQPGPAQSSLGGTESGVIYYSSIDNYDFIRGEDAVPIIVDGTLEIPLHHNGAVVILSHGSSGKSDRQTRWAKFLQAQGYATFNLNHFGPRNVVSTVHAQVRVTAQQMAGDVIYAARLLATDPRFKADRIYHIGWSKGGTAGLAAAVEYSAEVAADTAALIAGYVEFYPYCGFIGEVSTAARVLILHGKQDDWSPYGPCERLTAAMQKLGSDVKLVGFDDALHGFDSWNRSKLRIPTAIAIRDDSPGCTLIYSRQNPLISAEGSHSMGNFQARKKFLKSCASLGVTIGGSARYRETVEQMLLEFIQR